jgi:hypothetical protein
VCRPQYHRDGCAHHDGHLPPLLRCKRARRSAGTQDRSADAAVGPVDPGLGAPLCSGGSGRAAEVVCARACVCVCVAAGAGRAGYAPLGVGAVLSNPAVQGVATALNKSAAAVALRWLVQVRRPGNHDSCAAASPPPPLTHTPSPRDADERVALSERVHQRLYNMMMIIICALARVAARADVCGGRSSVARSLTARGDHHSRRGHRHLHERGPGYLLMGAARVRHAHPGCPDRARPPVLGPPPNPMRAYHTQECAFECVRAQSINSQFIFLCE